MTSVWQDYEERCEEIDTYFDHLSQEINNPGSTDDHKKIMKAHAFLMIYNMLESTVRNAIEEIISSINRASITYEQAIDEVRAIWLEYNYKKFADTNSKVIVNTIDTIKQDVININYDKYKKKKGNDLSGNVRPGVIDELAEKYKFDKNVRINGADMNIVMNHRNSLAHGNESYTQVGRKYSEGELLKFKRTCYAYLKEFLLCVRKYIREELYKR